jgi:hypothetical protein
MSYDVRSSVPNPPDLGRFFSRDAPDIRPDNPAFFDIRYPAGYQIALPDIRPDIRLIFS